MCSLCFSFTAQEQENQTLVLLHQKNARAKLETQNAFLQKMAQHLKYY